MQVHIVTAAGKSLTLGFEAPATVTTEDVAARLQESEGVPTVDQHLSRNGIALASGQHLHDGDVVLLVVLTPAVDFEIPLDYAGAKCTYSLRLVAPTAADLKNEIRRVNGIPDEQTISIRFNSVFEDPEIRDLEDDEPLLPRFTMQSLRNADEGPIWWMWTTEFTIHGSMEDGRTFDYEVSHHLLNWPIGDFFELLIESECGPRCNEFLWYTYIATGRLCINGERYSRISRTTVFNTGLREGSVITMHRM